MTRMQHPADSPIGAGTAPERRLDPAILGWLLGCCALVFAMVVIGGITRLTHSGLSMVEWQPLVGALPPLDQEQWQEIFLKYQETPEYRQVNKGMSLAEFKGIFWWEYIHRLLGRLIGAAFLLPLLWFTLRRRIARSLVPKLLGIFALGALQGAMGWYLVKSGLVDDPRVSQYRLTAHLGIAFLIYAAMLWVALDLLHPRGTAGESASARGLPRLAIAITALIFVMALSGGLVAGTRAGLAYNTFPLMNGHLLPPGLFAAEPWYLNFVTNVTTVQFDHRLIAWLLALLVPWLWLQARRAPFPRARLGADLLLGALALQIALGISTLVLAVPVALAAAHQGGALIVFAAALFLVHSLR
jgi:cytochrome c oxidase assembly protein subunit 15